MFVVCVVLVGVKLLLVDLFVVVMFSVFVLNLLVVCFGVFDVVLFMCVLCIGDIVFGVYFVDDDIFCDVCILMLFLFVVFLLLVVVKFFGMWEGGVDGMLFVVLSLWCLIECVFDVECGIDLWMIVGGDVCVIVSVEMMIDEVLVLFDLMWCIDVLNFGGIVLMFVYFVDGWLSVIGV